MSSSEPLVGADAPAAVSPSSALRWHMGCIIGCYAVFAINWAVIATIAPFFPDSDAGLAVGPVIVGLVFAAYPFATALFTPVVPCVLGRLGNRCGIHLGLLICSGSALAFGAAPSVVGVDRPRALSAALLATRAVGGTAAAVAEAGALAVLSTLEGLGQHLGKLLAGIEVVIGVAMSIGFAVGGGLYVVGGGTPFGAFFFPFIVWGVATLAAIPLLLNISSGPKPAAEAAAAEEEDEAAAKAAAQREPVAGVTVGFVTTAVAITLSAVIYQALTPVLEPHLDVAPYNLTEAQVGGVFTSSTVSYMLAALPIGAVVDRYAAGPNGKSSLKLMQLFGYATLVAGTLAIGPGCDALIAAELPRVALWVNLASVFFCFGAGIAFTIVPTLPDMREEAGGDAASEERQAKVCALWNGLYSLGAGIGPLISAPLVQAQGFTRFCVLFAYASAAMAALLLGAAARARLHARLARSTATLAVNFPPLSAGDLRPPTGLP